MVEKHLGGSSSNVKQNRPRDGRARDDGGEDGDAGAGAVVLGRRGRTRCRCPGSITFMSAHCRSVPFSSQRRTQDVLKIRNDVWPVR